jgi:CTP:molybdopterin cytidylyltransferase MocA
MRAIVLCGGEGSRLRGLVPDVPKALAPIRGEPFLDLLLTHLEKCGFTDVTLCVGYKREQIIDRYKDGFRSLIINFSVEEKPLGTGGAIRRALKDCEDYLIFVFNGDTMCNVHYRNVIRNYWATQTNVTIVEVVDRLGHGCGVYLINRLMFLSEVKYNGKFSFERWLKKKQISLRYLNTNPLCDIGTPHGYAHAQQCRLEYTGRWFIPKVKRPPDCQGSPKKKKGGSIPKLDPENLESP